MVRWLLSPTLAVIALALAVRTSLLMSISQPVVSDSLSYWTMATTAQSGTMRDVFGQIAFYSAGYPLLLAAMFKLTTPSLSMVFVTNLALAALSTWLVMAIARSVRNDPLFVVLAGIGYALLIPAAYAVGLVQKENLSTPLLLLVVLASMRMAHSERQTMWACVTGVAFAAGLLTGMASLPLGLIILIALYALGRQRGGRLGLILTVTAGATLIPWLTYTHAELGSPVITTNGGFNLYLGNNPAATGNFVSIADTPVGPRWEAMRSSLGEKGATDALGSMAIAYALDNPWRTVQLGVIKLGLFWAPNVPDAQDARSSEQIYADRWVEVIQYATLCLLGLFAAIRYHRSDPRLLWLVGTILAYWSLHAAVYIIPRYRDPVMPLVVILAALPITTSLRSIYPRLAEVVR